MSADMVESIAQGAVQNFRGGMQRHTARLQIISQIANARLQHPTDRYDSYSAGDWLDDIEDKLADAYADGGAVRRTHLIEVAALALAAVESIDIRAAADGA
jgi:hypothetical protein